MAGANQGLLEWSLDKDKEGHRDYIAKWLVQTSSVFDGPGVVLNTPDLPQVGSFWAIGNDSDPWAFCWPDWKIRQIQHRPGEISDLWIVEQKFTTKPLKRCQDESITDPLLMAPDISGSFVKRTKRATVDRFGKAIKSSSHEQFTGPLTEFDDNRPTVNITMNLASLPLGTYYTMVDTTNDAVLWDTDPGCIKLSDVQWARKLYGLCNYYYTVTYVFEIDGNAFVREIVDMGTKVLKPGGVVTNPADFEVYGDSRGASSLIPLNGAGLILADGAEPFIHSVDYYPRSNLLLLGIPATL